MANVIRSPIIKIGNSQGIRIPKLLLEQANLEEEVELELGHGQILTRPVRHTRFGWEEAFQAMAAQGDDDLLDAGSLVPATWDEEE